MDLILHGEPLKWGPPLNWAKKTLIFGLYKKFRLWETLNYLAYADTSTDAKWLKTVARKNRGPIGTFEISSFTLNFEHKNFTFQFSKVPFS